MNSSMVSSKSISRNLSFSTPRILRSDSCSCDIVERSTLLIIFNSLWPSSIRAILKLFPRLEKQPGFFSCLIIWCNANKFDSLDTEDGVGIRVKVSKLKFFDSGVVIGVVKFFCRLQSPELDCRISKSTDSQFAILWNEISFWGIHFWRCAMPLKGCSARTNITQFCTLQIACHFLNHCLKTVLRHIIAQDYCW